MNQPHTLSFPPFRFDCLTSQLWQNEGRVALRPKAAAILHYFLYHPQQLIPKGGNGRLGEEEIVL